MAKQQQDGEALQEQFLTALTAANSHTAKPAAVKAFKNALDECKAAGRIPWDRLKDPLTAARDFAIEKSEQLLGPALPCVWREQALRVRAELGFEHAPALERVLIEHAVLCYLRLSVMELRYSAAVDAGNTLAAVEHYERRLTVAQKRFTRACESLAKVRKMKLPAVQINVAAGGGQQINVA